MDDDDDDESAVVEEADVVVDIAGRRLVLRAISKRIMGVFTELLNALLATNIVIYGASFCFSPRVVQTLALE